MVLLCYEVCPFQGCLSSHNYCSVKGLQEAFGGVSHMLHAGVQGKVLNGWGGFAVLSCREVTPGQLICGSMSIPLTD